MNALVDIIMCTYNHEKYIAKAIDSVLMQKTEFNIRLLIGEDFSTDGTRVIIKKYAALYPEKIEAILHDQNVGVNENAKAVFNKIKGKYFAFLDGDDYWTDPYKLQKQVEFLENNSNYSMCFTDSIIIDENSALIKNERVPKEYKRHLIQEDILKTYCPPGNTAVMRNEIFQKILPIFPKIINGDYFIFSLFASYGEIGYIDLNTAAYRMHSKSIWSNHEEDYLKINYIKVNRGLENLVLPENKNIVLNNIKSSQERLFVLNSSEQFTDNGSWTPQTAMLRSIRDAVLKIDGSPLNALSIDNNPTIEKMLIRKWPELEITIAKWPEYDAQNLHQFNDETFDIVFSHQVLEHIPKPWIAAKEMNRVLKKGGIGIHSSCAYNPRHGYPAFKDYYRFLPDGLAELFDGVNIWIKEGWGSKEAIIYNLTIDDGHGQLGGRRFVEAMGKKNDENYPWHTWVIFQKQ